MIEALERNAPINPPSVMAVFRLYSIDELTADQIARKCHCSKTTVIARLNLVHRFIKTFTEGH